MKLLRKILKSFAPKAFDDGLRRCNRLGLSLIRKQPLRRFLDVGCGDGRLTQEFAQALQAQEVYGVEYVDSLRQEAEAKGIRGLKWDLNGRWQAESNYFDMILSSQNIEHMHNTRFYLEECYRCLRPSGQLLVLTENLASWINTGALLFGWQPFSTTNIDGLSVGNPLVWHMDEPRDAEFITRNKETGVSGTLGHVRVWTYRALKELLQGVGFQNLKLATRGYLPLWGWCSDVMCRVNKTRGHFLIASGFKPGQRGS